MRFAACAWPSRQSAAFDYAELPELAGLAVVAVDVVPPPFELLDVESELLELAVLDDSVPVEEPPDDAD